MFAKLFSRKKPEIKVEGSHIVKDSKTHRIIAQGTEKMCLAFARGYGCSYVEEAG